MGDHEGWAQPSDLVPNGLLPNRELSVSRVLDPDRWSVAEERTAELIARIQPNQPSEELRNSVADYVQRLVMKCFSCQVFTFGSVPLKTYLPDGDIDLTAFSKNQNLKDTWANEVRLMLESEEKSDDAEFHVKEVQYIQAEVKLIKCLVENIVVDISFNQLGGLCTLCFLEEVDHLINQNHLFKRSIILIKAWCYYESRILGAHHGLISTYALETLVLYIFHVFNSSFSGPLEVLYRFLEFFSNFDWENFCVSLWGPVPIKSLPDMTAESPRKDGGELLLNRLFLDACSSVYAVFPAGQESQNQPFVSKHFNVVDPLRTNNNLGRSVSRGNFFRIRSAFAFGAKRLGRLLECPKEKITSELNQFFLNTLERHGTGHRPDAPTAGLLGLRQLNADHLIRPDNTKTKLRNKKKKNGSTTSHESGAEENRTSRGSSDQLDHSASEGMSSTSYIAPVSQTQRQKNYGHRTSSRVSDKISWNTLSVESVDNDKGQRNSKPDILVNDAQEKYPFARTHSSPELLNTSNDIPSQVRHNRAPEPGKYHIDSAKMEYNGRKNSSPEVSGTHGVRSSTNDPLVYNQSHQSVDASSDSISVSNNYNDDSYFHTFGDELSSLSETMEMHQEEQDMVNMMASSGYHGFNGHAQIPMNMGGPGLPIPIPPSVLASMGFSQRNFPGMIPAGIPLVDPHWHRNMQFPQGVSPSLSHYFRSMGLASNFEENTDMGNANQRFTEVSQEHGDQELWNEHETGSTRDFADGNRNMHSMQFDSKQNPTSVGQNVVPLSRNSSGSSSTRDQRQFSRESRGMVREDQADALHYQSDNRGREGYTTERTATLRSLTTSNTSSSRSKASSESSWDGSTVKGSKSIRDKRGRKVAPSPTPSTVSVKGKSGWPHEGGSVEQGYSHADDDIDWIPLSTMGTETGERNARPTSSGSSHIQNHQMPGYDLAQINGSESMLPIAPMVLGSGSQQRVMDNSGVAPFAFYPTGPPVPFLTMLPVYNFPNETGDPEGSSVHFDRDEDVENSRLRSVDSAECLDHSSESFSANSMKNGVSVDSLEEHIPDILNSDFNSHWHNLQFGRLCQNPRNLRPMLFPSPAMVPPMYLQGNFPWDGPGRPVSSNVNSPYQLISYGPRVVPVAPLQPGSSRPAGVYQHFSDEIPRYRGGTGTYLPNVKAPPPPSPRERQPPVHRNQRANNNYDHHEHLGEREGNWNMNSKPRYSGRQYGRTQSDKGSSRSDRYSQHDNRTNRVPWDSFRHGPYPPQEGPFGNSNSIHSNGPSTNGGVHGVYMQTVNSNGMVPNGPGGGGPSFVMLYPYNHNVGGYDSANEQVEFGTLGRVQLSNMNEVSQHDEGSPKRGGAQEQQRFWGGSALSSPEQPSSPRFERLANQKNYQLKAEDFPPLSLQTQGGNDDDAQYHRNIYS